MDILTTNRTYKTRENAEAFLSATLAKAGFSLDDARYVIAVNNEGRFAPVMFASAKIPVQTLIGFAHVGVTVVG